MSEPVVGYVVEATADPEGSQIVASSAAGVGVLASVSVESATDFDNPPVPFSTATATVADQVGVLDINGVQVGYVGYVEGDSADDPDVIYLVGDLPASDAGDWCAPVRGGQIPIAYELIVSLGDGEPVRVPTPFEQRERWPIGPYDEPVEVELSPDLETLVGVPGRTPVVDLAYASIPFLRVDQLANDSVPSGAWTNPAAWSVAGEADPDEFSFDGSEAAIWKVGAYSVVATVAFQANASGVRGVRIRQDYLGTIRTVAEVTSAAVVGLRTTLQVSSLVRVEGGTLWVEVLQDSGAALDLLGNGDGTFSNWTIVRTAT